MIDQFLEFIATPILIIAIQIVIICMNQLTVKEKDEMGLFKTIIWLIITLVTFPSLLGIALQVTSQFTLVYISLSLFFLQLFMNVEYLLKDYHKSKERR